MAQRRRQQLCPLRIVGSTVGTNARGLVLLALLSCCSKGLAMGICGMAVLPCRVGRRLLPALLLLLLLLLAMQATAWLLCCLASRFSASRSITGLPATPEAAACGSGSGCQCPFCRHYCTGSQNPVHRTIAR